MFTLVVVKLYCCLSNVTCKLFWIVYLQILWFLQNGGNRKNGGGRSSILYENHMIFVFITHFLVYYPFPCAYHPFPCAYYWFPCVYHSFTNRFHVSTRLQLVNLFRVNVFINSSWLSKIHKVDAQSQREALLLDNLFKHRKFELVTQFFNQLNFVYHFIRG